MYRARCRCDSFWSVRVNNLGLRLNVILVLSLHGRIPRHVNVNGVVLYSALRILAIIRLLMLNTSDPGLKWMLALMLLFSIMRKSEYNTTPQLLLLTDNWEESDNWERIGKATWENQ